MLIIMVIVILIDVFPQWTIIKLKEYSICEAVCKLLTDMQMKIYYELNF